jgi:Domain of unknown function (DUF1905)
MSFSFKAKIYKVGVNPVVEVPYRITAKMKPVKGYIPVKGKIEGHPFVQTLCPVKNAPYRLYVNGPMLKGSQVGVGDIAEFSLVQDHANRDKKVFRMLPALRQALEEHQLHAAFKKQILSRQKETLRYLAMLKTEESVARNIQKVIASLREGKYFLSKK